MLYVPEVEEIRISPVIARKGYLNVLEHKTNGWKKRWVVCTCILIELHLLNYLTISYVFLLNYLLGCATTVRFNISGRKGSSGKGSYQFSYCSS